MAASETCWVCDKYVFNSVLCWYFIVLYFRTPSQGATKWHPIFYTGHSAKIKLSK